MTRFGPRLLIALACVAGLAAACSGDDDAATSSSNARSGTVANTALANSQGGALEVIRYDAGADGSILDAAELPGAIAISIDLGACEQVDITTWRVSGTVELSADEPIQGWLRFGTARPVRPMDLEVQVNHSGSFEVDIPTHGLSDLAASCDLTSPDGELRYSEATARPFEGVFTWDAEEGSIASLGVGLVAGEAADPRRAWAEHYWFGPDLPFAPVLAVDRSLIGVPVTQGVSVFAPGPPSSCQIVIQTFAVGELTQARGCTPTDLDVLAVAGGVATWERYGLVEGLVFSEGGVEYLYASSGDSTIIIAARSTGVIVELATALAAYDTSDPAGGSPGTDLTEDELVETLRGEQFREVGRIDADGERFLVLEGPLNPEIPSDYLLQLRVYRLSGDDNSTNAVLVAGGSWDRCLGIAPGTDGASFVITGNSGDTVEQRVGSAWQPLEGTGRILAASGLTPSDELRLLIDGEVVECTTPIITTLPSTAPTTTGTTVPGSTDTTIPGATDTTTP